MKRLRITVRGEVQGVFYRHSAAEQAGRLGITGSAMNAGDGSVVIEAQGAEASLERFLDWCRQGPDLAKVGSVSSDAIPEVEGETGFVISW